jgi:predicted dehydrogenase|tara:strand:- start:134 stop:1108 length:975 start_codon:yes stop_codon:yes gene_type:complete
MINAVIVDLGGWGQTLVTSVQGKSDLIRFTRGVTRTPSKAADYAAEMGFPLDDDYAAALADPEIDAVVLATPHTQHAEQMEAAAAAGKHIFVEKPFTLTKESAAASVAAAEKAGIVLALGHNRRFLPAVAELRRRIEAGELGTLSHVDANFSGNPSLRYPADAWRADPAEAPAGAMSPIGIHMVDLLIGLFGPIAEVHAQSFRLASELPIDDTTSMLFRFETGMTACFATLGATARMLKLVVYGNKAWAELRGEPTLVITSMDGEEEVVEFPPFDKEKAELEAFAEAVEGKSAYPIPGEEAIHGIAVFEAIVRSIETGETAPVA